MRAVLAANLRVEDPGAVRDRLRRLAIFRRKGRLPQGQRRWVHLYHNGPDALVLPIGLWSLVRQQVPGPWRVVDRRWARDPLDFGWHGQLYPDQARAVAAVAQCGGGVLVAPPGSGKTLMGWALAARWGQPTLWLVHTRDLALQARLRAQQVLDVPARRMGWIGAGEDDSGTPDIWIWIAMVQTLARQPAIVHRLARRVGTVIADECHHTPAETIRRLLVQLPARYKLGLSGTPDRTDGLGPMMRALLGPVVRVPLTTLVRAGRLLLPQVYRVPTAFRYSGADKSWAALDRARAQDRARLRLTVGLLRRLAAADRRVLCLVHRVDHARTLAAACQAAGVPAQAVVGAVTPALRQRYYGEAEAGRLVLVATRLADEGLDLPRLDTLVLAAAGRSDVRLQQQVGRIMRVAPGKRDAWVVDVMDPGVPTLRYQARVRAWVYRQWGLTVADLPVPPGLARPASRVLYNPM